MKANRWLVPLIAIVFLLGSVWVARAMGWWQTTGTNITTLDDASPDDIRGSSTLGDVSQTFGIPLAELRSLLGLPGDVAAETQLKELEAYNEVSVVRAKVAEYLGVPYEGGEEALEAPTAPQATASPAQEAGPSAPASFVPASEIKGSWTLQQVSDDCGIPLDVLYQEAKLKSDISASTALKDLKNQMPDFEVSALRDVVAAYQAR